MPARVTPSAAVSGPSASPKRARSLARRRGCPRDAYAPADRRDRSPSRGPSGRSRRGPHRSVDRGRRRGGGCASRNARGGSRHRGSRARRPARRPRRGRRAGRRAASPTPSHASPVTTPARVQAGAPQDLVGVAVADAEQQALVHQEGLELTRAPRRAPASSASKVGVSAGSRASCGGGPGGGA